MHLVPARRRRLRRNVLLSLGAIAILTIAWFIIALITFVLPGQQPLRPADAIVVLSPPRERLPVAVNAAEAGLAPKLLVSRVEADLLGTYDNQTLSEICSEPSTTLVVCFEPVSDDTFGEARAVAELLESTDADSIIVATNVSHSARARYLFERCLPPSTEVQVLLVHEPDVPLYRLGRMLYESAAFAKALIEASACDE